MSLLTELRSFVGVGAINIARLTALQDARTVFALRAQCGQGCPRSADRDVGAPKGAPKGAPSSQLLLERFLQSCLRLVVGIVGIGPGQHRAILGHCVVPLAR